MNTPKNKKMLKMAKICLIACIVLCVTLLPCSAIYEYGNTQTARMFAPLNITVSIGGAVAELTPTITFTNTNDTVSVANSETANTQGLLRNNWGFATKGLSVLECAYRLKFDSLPSSDEFALNLNAYGGYYDFSKYGIPQMSLPQGYTAVSLIEYDARYVGNDGAFPTNSTFKVVANHTATENPIINLLAPTVNVDGAVVDIYGDWIITNYRGGIVFTSFEVGETPSEYGDPGYYLWNEVLTTPWFDEQHMGTPDQWVYLDGVTIIGSIDGVVDEYNLAGILPMDIDGFGAGFTLDYDISPDYNLVVYDTDGSGWYHIHEEDYNIEITPMQLRCLKFTKEFYDTFNMLGDYVPPDEWTGTDRANYEAYVQEFSNWFRENTIYSLESPIMTNEYLNFANYQVTDGGLYVNYYVDGNAHKEYNRALEGLFNRGVAVGGGQGGTNTTDFTSWLVGSVGSFMDFYIIPDVLSVGGLLAVTVGLALMIAFLKFFAGG